MRGDEALRGRTPDGGRVMDAPGRAQLVFVHGIGGLRKSEQERRDWLKALADGARAAGHSDAVSGITQSWLMDAHFVNFSDLFTEEEAQGVAPAEPVSDVELAHGLVREITDELLLQAREQGDHAAIRVMEDAQSQFPEDARELQGTLEPVRILARILTTVLQMPGLRKAGQWVSGSPLLGDLSQVGAYLDRGGREDGREALDVKIRARVESVVDPRQPLVVVAHSLGSVVAYEALHQLPGATRLFVTLGSPLATAGVVLHRVRPHPPRTPEGVEQWLNFWDRDDIVVCRPRIKAWMQASSAGVVPVSHRVDSDGVWVHTATKYLRQPAVAGKIVEALKQ
ncbi:hypothetical protein [Streptomyces sp. NPDC055099]